MRQYITLEDITDGRLYSANDLVKLECGECSGCSACCCDMEALLLDPYDIHALKHGLSINFQQLLEHGITLSMTEGLILPLMNTQGESGSCSFLSKDGRCKIHSFRPGICRLFPLGRYYHDGTFSYILQLKECKKKRTGKVKIKKWLDLPDFKKYEAFVLTWHDLLSSLRSQLSTLTQEQSGILQNYLLRTFFVNDYSDHFYEEFEERCQQFKNTLGL